MAKRLASWLQPAKPPEKAATSLDGPSSPSQTTLPADRLKEIQAAVEASPSKIAVIFVRDHQVDGKSMHASTKFKFADGSPSWDHVAIAWMDANGNLVFAEARPVNGATGVALFGKNDPGTATQLVTEYKDFKVLPIDLGRYGPGARDAFVNAVSAATGPGSNYSATNRNIGTVCSAAVQRGLDAAYAAHKPLPGWVQKLKASIERIWLLGVNQLNLYTPKTAYEDVAKHSVPFKFNPAAPQAKREWLRVGEVKMGVVVVETDKAELGGRFLASSSAAVASVSDQAGAALLGAIDFGEQALPSTTSQTGDARTDDAALQLVTGHGEQVSQEVVENASEDAFSDVSLQDPETDEDDEDLEEEVRLASDSQDVRTDDAFQQPAIDDDADDDDEDMPTDDRARQPAIDDDDDDDEQADDEEEEPAHASDSEDAPTADALMQTAKAEVGADADDQAGPQHGTSAPDIPDAGFSFSLFAKPGIPLEVASEAMPAKQPSPEALPDSGVPGSESTHPDLDSANVGSAAPGHERVVHHGDLAP
jgi:hypothetical protein